MKVNPTLRLENNIFYNTICLIMAIFCIACFWTSMNMENKVVNSKTYNGLQEGSIYGPIKVKKGQSKICTIKANFYGDNASAYLSGEVLDEDKDTLYEFGKDFWHESGYDSEGYWSESERNMKADLTFSEEGTYYIQFNTEENSMYNIGIEIQVKKGTGIPHLMMGTIILILLLFIFYFNNRDWIAQFADKANDVLEDMCDD